MFFIKAFSCFSLGMFWTCFFLNIIYLNEYSSFTLQYSTIYKWYVCLEFILCNLLLAQTRSFPLIYGEEWPFSAWSMICRMAFFRLLALSISCSLVSEGSWTDQCRSLVGEMDPDGTSWPLASSLRALTKESSFSFTWHTERETHQHKSNCFFFGL